VREYYRANGDAEQLEESAFTRRFAPTSPREERREVKEIPYCTLSATNRSSPSAFDTSSRMDFLPSFFS
jgi:hypothetical protein